VLEDITASALEQARHPYIHGLLARRPPFDRKIARLPVAVRPKLATRHPESGGTILV